MKHKHTFTHTHAYSIQIYDRQCVSNRKPLVFEMECVFVTLISYDDT